MASAARRLGMVFVLSLLAGAVTTVLAQTQTKSTETRQFEVVSVQGNHLVVKGAEGAREFTVPEDFRFTVNGKSVPVSELKPGMKGTATITTTTTVTPVTVTEVRNGEVMRASGNSVVVRTPDGIRMFGPRDVSERNATIMRNGQPIDISQLRQGDRLTATIVTQKPPQVLTERQYEATLTGAPPPPPPPSAAAKAGAAVGKAASATKDATVGAAKATAGAAKDVAGATKEAATATAGAAKSPATRKLPKTASQMPLIGLVGLVLLAVGAMLTMSRRRA